MKTGGCWVGGEAVKQGELAGLVMFFLKDA